MRKMLLVIGILIVALAIWKMDELTSIASAVKSVVSEDIIGELLPFQSKAVSSLQRDDVQLEVVCSRNLFTYSISLHIENSNSPGKSIFVAEKDTVQNCNEYIMEKVEQDAANNLYHITFRNDHRMTVEIPR